MLFLLKSIVIPLCFGYTQKIGISESTKMLQCLFLLGLASVCFLLLDLALYFFKQVHGLVVIQQLLFYTHRRFCMLLHVEPE